VRIRVDPERCQGHSRCYAVAPHLFDIDDYGMSTATNDGVVAEGDVSVARLAVMNCPERAIEIVDE
jgi:ferredoxin